MTDMTKRDSHPIGYADDGRILSPIVKSINPIRIEWDAESAEDSAAKRAHVEAVVEDTLEIITSKRALIDFRGVQDAHIRIIARNAAGLALLGMRNPERIRKNV